MSGREIYLNNVLEALSDSTNPGKLGAITRGPSRIEQDSGIWDLDTLVVSVPN
jgi:hypothetical protein